MSSAAVSKSECYRIYQWANSELKRLQDQAVAAGRPMTDAEVMFPDAWRNNQAIFDKFLKLYKQHQDQPTELMLSDLLEERGLNYLARFMRGEVEPPGWLLGLLQEGESAPLPIVPGKTYHVEGMPPLVANRINFDHRHQNIWRNTIQQDAIYLGTSVSVSFTPQTHQQQGQQASSVAIDEYDPRRRYPPDTERMIGRAWPLNAETREPDVTWEQMLGVTPLGDVERVIDRANGPDRTVTAVAGQELRTGQPVVWLPNGKVGAANRKDEVDE